LSVLKIGAPDSVRCTRPYNFKPTTLGNSRARSAIIHRTVWCATGAMAICANGRLCKVNSVTAEVRAAKSESTGLSGVAPDCPVPQEDKAPTIDPAPNPNGWVTGGAPDKEQCLSGGAPDCQQPPQRLWKWLGAINIPPTTSFITIQAFQTSHSIQEQKTPLQDTSNRLNPL
jgi:hypothetical protein